jgi:spore maturation protein CgeB
MKILIPNYSVADSFTDNVAYTLNKIGHEVLTMPRISPKIEQSPYWRLFFTVKEKMSNNYLTPQEKWLLKQLDTFKPQLVLTLTQVLSESVLHEIKKRRIYTATWWGDPPANMQRQGLLSSQWDFIFIKDPNAVQKFKRVGLNAELLHEAMNPDWHKPIAKQSNNKVVVAGSFYDYRNYLVKILLDHDIEVDLYGRRLASWVDERIRKLHHGKYIIREGKSKAFGEGLACLNSTNMREGNSMNCRAFEIAGAGGLQLMEQREIISDCFEPEKEILVFDSVEELIERVNFAKNHVNEARLIREAGYKRALSEHTYEKRLNYILSKFK